MNLSYSKKRALVFATALFLLLADRFLKILALNFGNNKLSLLPFLDFHYALNPGLGFSFLSNSKLALILPILVFLIILFIANKIQKNNKNQALLLYIICLFGASNLFDRFKYGGVIDYFDLHFFIANLADALISLFIILLFLDTILKKNNSNATN